MFKKIFRLRNLFYGVLAIIVLALGWYAYVQITGFSNRVTNSWKEIEFAYEHASIVQSVRENYASKSAELDESFKVKEQTVQDKLLNELTSQLQGKKL